MSDTSPTAAMACRKSGPAKSGPAMRALLCATVLVPMGLASVAAQEQTTTTTSRVTTLDEVVLTASGFEQLVRDAPASVSVISGEELRRSSVSSLTDALSGVQGVAVTGTANESDIFIRGLPGAYTLILVDGKRQSTRDARTNGNAGFEQSFIPPVLAIERIEVVRGPMSSLYGSDAMGGVINIITKKVAPVWGGEVKLDTVLNQDSMYGDRRQASFYLNGPIIDDKLGLQIWGRRMKREEGGSLDAQNAQDDYDLTARLAWTPTDNQEIYLEAGKTKLENQAYDTASYNEHTRDHVALTHKGDWSFGQSEISLSREVAQRTPMNGGGTANISATRAPEITNTVLDAKLNSQIGDHKLTFGGQFFRAELHDQNPGMNNGKYYDFRADQWAVFVEDEWTITEDFALTMGVRYNDHDQYSGVFTPRIYGVWSASNELTIKGGISTGFRAPDIRTITPGYAYTTGGGSCNRGTASNGWTPTCGVIIADPDLKAEKSTSFELAALWEDGTFEFGATAFYTDFKDKIENYNTGELWDGPMYQGAGTQPGNTGLFQRYIWLNRNVASATIKGLELTAAWEISPDLNLRGNYTYTNSKQDTGDYRGFPLARTPEHMASLRLDWETPVEGLHAWGAANYHGSEINAGARTGTNGRQVTINGATGRKYDGYRTVDLGVEYALNDRVDLSAAVYNIFDEQVEVDESNTLIEGRRLWLAVTTRF